MKSNISSIMLLTILVIVINMPQPVIATPFFSKLIKGIAGNKYKDLCNKDSECQEGERCGLLEHITLDYLQFDADYNSTLRFRKCIRQSDCDQTLYNNDATRMRIRT